MGFELGQPGRVTQTEALTADEWNVYVVTGGDGDSFEMYQDNVWTNNGTMVHTMSMTQAATRGPEILQSSTQRASGRYSGWANNADWELQNGGGAVLAEARVYSQRLPRTVLVGITRHLMTKWGFDGV